MDDSKKCLLVFPCFNPTIQQWVALEQFCSKLQDSSPKIFEFLVIDDGSPDWIEAKTLAANTKVIRLSENQGKGAALRAATNYLTSEHLIFAFLDFDLPFCIEDLLGIIASVQNGADFCIGDRSLNLGSNRFSRKVAHKLFRLFMRMIITGGVADTQCGIKAYDAKALKFLVSKSVVNGFLFDVEWIYVALKHKMSVRCWPVTVLDKHESSSLRSFRVFTLFSQLILIVFRILSQQYENQDLFKYMELRRKKLI